MPTVRTDREVIENRLVTVRRTVDCLGALGAVSVQRLADQPSIGLVIERDLWLIRDMASAIDVTIASMRGYPRSAGVYDATVRAGVIDDALAARLEPADGPHHVLLQLCLDTEPGEVEDVVSSAVSAFREYARLATEWNSLDQSCAVSTPS
ncbi:MAG: hypothetical protein QM572_06135 [Nocardioides sp.]|uniref:hypothetical protein n=1 Tax=Nocardioides sp. TaxID=35761 RepID=UPI0039E28E4E